MVFERTTTPNLGGGRYWGNVLWYPLVKLVVFGGVVAALKFLLWFVFSVSGVFRRGGMIDMYLLTRSEEWRSESELVQMGIESIRSVLDSNLFEVFLALMIVLLVWVIVGGTMFRIDGPGLVRGKIIFWLALLLAGTIGMAIRSWMSVVVENADYFQAGMNEMVVLGLASLLAIAFYIGSVVVSAPHLRGALPGARIVL